MADTLALLADSFKNMGVARAYGTPVNLGGEEVVPVALVSFGFGGGTESEEGASGGGGGGFVAAPGCLCDQERAAGVPAEHDRPSGVFGSAGRGCRCGPAPGDCRSTEITP